MECLNIPVEVGVLGNQVTPETNQQNENKSNPLLQQTHSQQNYCLAILIQSIIFLLKEFKDWEAIHPKTYPTLKTFIGGACTHRILAMQLRNT